MSETVERKIADKRSFLWLRVPSRILIVVVVIGLLPTVPIVGTMALNEFRLWNFARQLRVFDEVAENTYSVLIAQGRNISVAGNANDCNFQAARMYQTFGGFSTEQTAIWNLAAQSHAFGHARKPDDGSNAEVYLNTVDNLLIVKIDSGGFPAGLDFRCW